MLLCTRVPKLHVPAAELWKELVLDVHEASALVTSINMAGGACKCGVGSLVHRPTDGLIGVTATRLFCALVFPSVGQDQRNNQTTAGYPEGFGRAFQPFVLLS